MFSFFRLKVPLCSADFFPAGAQSPRDARARGPVGPRVCHQRPIELAHVPRSAEEGASRKREGRAGEGGSDARRGGDSVHS